MYIVANIGINWWAQKNSDQRAAQLVQAAVDSEAHGICVPYLKADKTYRQKDIVQQTQRFDMPPELLYDLLQLTKGAGITFWASPTWHEDIEYLEKIGVDGYHIQNGNLEYRPLIEAIAKTEKPIMMSTGFAEFDEISKAADAVLDIRDSDAAESELMLLHSTGAMPTPAGEAQLGRILDLAQEFMPLFVGYESFLSAGNTLLDYVAMAYRPSVIMRRIDLEDRKGIETEYSLVPEQFSALTDVALKMEWVNNPQFFVGEFTEGDWNARIKRRRCAQSEFLLPPSE